MWSIAQRLKHSWARWSLWKRAFLLISVICVVTQALVVRSLWRESEFRQRIRRDGNLLVRPSPPSGVASQLRDWVDDQRAELLAPIVELCCANPTTSDLDYIASLPHLKALSLSRRSSTRIRLPRLEVPPQVSMLELIDVELADNSLLELSRCPQLRRIRIAGKVTPESLEPLKHCQSLCELYLDGSQWNPHDRESPFTALHLATIAQIPHLKHLEISAGEIDDAELLGLADARELESLNVHQLHLHTDAVNVLGRLPRLRQLTLHPFDERALGFCEPTLLKGFPALKVLSVTNSRITPAFVAALAKFPKLEALSFNDINVYGNRSRVSDVVAELGELPHLKLLDLTATDMELTPLRKIGHLNASSQRGYFIDERISPKPNQDAASPNQCEPYFSQPEWPRICGRDSWYRYF